MSDPTTAAPGTGLGYNISMQYVKDLSFENPRAPHVFTGGGVQPQVQVSVGVSVGKLADTAYEVTLTLNTEAKQGDDNVFIAELSYAGVVVLQGAPPEEQVQHLLMIEVPKHLFPFARAVLSNATRDGGFPPLLLNPVDFETLYHQQRQQQPATGTA
jgi:preprotein translocase subunit SecB